MEQIKCCGSCKYLYKKVTEKPCMDCIHYNKWVINDNLKELNKKEKRK